MMGMRVPNFTAGNLHDGSPEKTQHNSGTSLGKLLIGRLADFQSQGHQLCLDSTFGANSWH